MSEIINKEKVAQLRRVYHGKGLDEKDVKSDPMEQFEDWFEAAVENNLVDANAMTLGTANKDGQPSSRIVLLKGFDERGFIFYTNYNSRKSNELDENPFAALCFYWKEFDRQIRIRGEVDRLPREESADYFKSRPRDSQIGAWASHQSDYAENREELEQRFKTLEEKYEGDDVPLPDFWGGYVLDPVCYEFWQGRPSRMHDRIVYEKNNGNWEIKRLYP